MYSPTSNSPMLANTTLNNPGDLDGSGTINPASLGPAGPTHLYGGQHLPFSPPATATSEFDPDSKRATLVDNVSPRGVKRSRSPDHSGMGGDDLGPAASEEPVRRKRGRPPKNKGSGVPPSPQLSNPPSQTHQPQQNQQQPPPPPNQASQPVGTPQLQHAAPPSQQTGTLPTPPKPTPTKTTTVKALPTVRDHTTDQLTREGDEYIPRETDEAGDKKVMMTGHLLGGREYRCRTFNVPNRGDKLFMLATECARVLGYRDSYLLFNKNRSLYKIIATQAEKDDLIQQELLPYSYRSRQIAIVTARSMFRQFGSRVIVSGRRVRDDYWEMKARKQGFTEDDPAGEKRPGAAKQRAAAANEQAAQAQQANQQQQQQQQQQGHTDPLYAHDSVQLDQQPQPQMVQPGLGGPSPVSLAPLPMIHVMPQEDRTSKELYSVPRPRQEITGAPYQDQTRSMPMSQMMDQAQQTADYNKTLTQNRNMRKQMYNELYTAKKSPPPQQVASPPLTHHAPPQHNPQPQHPHPQMHPPQPMMSPQQLSSLNHQQQHQHQQHPQHQQHQQHHQQHQPLHPMMQQSPVRPTQGIKPEQLHNPATGNYLPPGSYFHPSQAQPGHPQQPQPQHPQRPIPQQSHPQSMPGMHVQHPSHTQQSQGMYPPAAQQQFLQQQQQQQAQQQQAQQQHQYPPHTQGYRPQQAPQQQQQQWWSGA